MDYHPKELIYRMNKIGKRKKKSYLEQVRSQFKKFLDIEREQIHQERWCKVIFCARPKDYCGDSLFCHAQPHVKMNLC